MTTSNKTLTANITEGYKKNYVLYLSAYKRARLKPGVLRVTLEGHATFETEGTLNTAGLLSGMAKLYKALRLRKGDVLTCYAKGKDLLSIEPPRKPKLEFKPTKPTVFTKGKVNRHFEAFRPQNLADWSPQAEVDVYMAFGILEKYMPVKYCCGVKEETLREMGLSISPKPDAILIDRVTDQYLLAEFEKSSSDYAPGKHKPKDVDVLVCWTDDEQDRSKLPQLVIALADKAKEAALEILGFEPAENLPQ